MNETNTPRLRSSSERAEIRKYVLGLGLSLILTAGAFGLVQATELSRQAMLIAVLGAGVFQLFVQLRYFLHIDLAKSHRDDLQLIAFTVLLMAVMIGGTIWIAADQMAKMG